MPDDFELDGSPSDTITSLSWSPKTDHLIATSWAFDIRCWEVGRGGARAKGKKDAGSPVFCSSWNDDGKSVYFGTADGKACLWSLGVDKVRAFGGHDGPVAAIKPIPNKSLIATLGWDKTLKYWDPRNNRAVSVVNLPNRCFVMDVSKNFLVLGGAVKPDAQEVYVVRLDHPDRIAKKYTSALKRYMRALSIFADEKGWVCTGIEGRTAVEHFQPTSDTKLPDTPFAFKCHRKGQAENQVFPVHGLSCHPKTRTTFASCGGDGTLAYWDRRGKTRLQHYYKGTEIPMTALSFNSSGNYLAFAKGYDWARGAKDRTSNVSLHIRRVQDKDLQPGSTYR